MKITSGEKFVITLENRAEAVAFRRVVMMSHPIAADDDALAMREELLEGMNQHI